MATLLPLACKSPQVVLIVLSSMRVAIGLLMAGAGVIGIAVWLGAQMTIAEMPIADVLSRVFFLLEKAFQIGHSGSEVILAE